MKNKKKSLIEQWLDSDDKSTNHYEELFNPSNERIDVKTELDDREIGWINGVKHNKRYLESKGIKCSFYDSYLTNHMRLKVSRDRKSRGEYVEVNKKHEPEQPQFTIQK